MTIYIDSIKRKDVFYIEEKNLSVFSFAFICTM